MTRRHGAHFWLFWIVRLSIDIGEESLSTEMARSERSCRARSHAFVKIGSMEPDRRTMVLPTAERPPLKTTSFCSSPVLDSSLFSQVAELMSSLTVGREHTRPSRCPSLHKTAKLRSSMAMPMYHSTPRSIVACTRRRSIQCLPRASRKASRRALQRLLGAGIQAIITHSHVSFSPLSPAGRSQDAMAVVIAKSPI